MEFCDECGGFMLPTKGEDGNCFYKNYIKLPFPPASLTRCVITG